MFLGRELTTRFGSLDESAMESSTRKVMGRLNPNFKNFKRPVMLMSGGQRQSVAIARAIQFNAKVLIMDEPTAALTVGEVERLFAIMRRLSASGVGIVYISHRLEEVPEIADRVTVMRDGRVAGVTRPDAPQAELVRLLVGRPLEELYPRRSAKAGRRLLRLQNARFRPARERAGWQVPRQISLDVHEGEIVGLAGVMGAGRTELLSALYGTGLAGRWTGGVEVDGRPVRLDSIRAARRAGIAFVTDDRRGGGLMLRMAVGRNLVMSVIRRISPGGFLSGTREAEAVRQSFGQFDIRPRNPDIAVGALSGGNQQKVVLAKEILGNPRLLLLDEPTRGVDVGAKGEIYARLRDLASQGLGILVASSEMPELVGLCDRIVVLREGCSVATFEAGVDEHAILAAANGEARDVQP